MKTDITKYGEIRTPTYKRFDRGSERNPARTGGDSARVLGEAVGVLISIVALISPVVILYFYYTRMSYRPVLLLHQESFVLHICLCLFLITLIFILGVAIAYAILFAVYTVLGGHDFHQKLLDLTESAVGISLIRLILIAGSVVLSIGANYFVSVEIIYGFFPKIPWIIGPFSPLIVSAFAAWIVHLANE